jgi:hypothetical protein
MSQEPETKQGYPNTLTENISTEGDSLQSPQASSIHLADSQREKFSERLKKIISRPRLIIILIMLVIAIPVSVLALIAKYYQRQQSLPQTITTHSLSPTISVLSTENWKTYENIRLGFSLKYPNDWDYSIANDSIPPQFSMGLSPKKVSSQDPTVNPFITVIVDDFPSLDDHINNLYCNGNCSLSSQKTSLGGVEAKEVDTELSSYRLRRVVVENYQKTYEVNILFFNLFENEYPFEERERIFNSVLSSFNFLPDISEWETYSNNDLNLTFRYPSYYEPMTNWLRPQDVHQSGTLLIREGLYFGTDLPACSDNIEPPRVNCIGSRLADCIIN